MAQRDIDLKYQVGWLSDIFDKKGVSFTGDNATLILTDNPASDNIFSHKIPKRGGYAKSGGAVRAAQHVRNNLNQNADPESSAKVPTLSESTTPSSVQQSSDSHTPFRQPRQLFEGGEHTYIGDQVHLYLDPEKPETWTEAKQIQLNLPNGLRLSYGQIVALGGDFYGIPEKPISGSVDAGEIFAALPELKRAEGLLRFKQAYLSLAGSTENSEYPLSLAGKDPKEEVPEILGIMAEEIDAARQAMADGANASDAYQKLGDSLSIKWNSLTLYDPVLRAMSKVPSMAGLPWPYGRYMELAFVNYDHFGEDAQFAYQMGHLLALQTAALASGDRKRNLEIAYTMNAFADHFLTDLFSAGHLRTPRRKLRQIAESYGNPLARMMHDEDCRFGLFVSNRNGDHWRCYGDSRYADTLDEDNRQIIRKAVQSSVNEIFEANCTQTIKDPKEFEALRYTPNLAALRAHLGFNHQPLFKFEIVNQIEKVTFRKNYNDLNSIEREDLAISEKWDEVKRRMEAQNPILSLGMPSHYASPARQNRIKFSAISLSLYGLLKKGYQPENPATYLAPPPSSAKPEFLDTWTDMLLPVAQQNCEVRYAFSLIEELPDTQGTVWNNESYIGGWSEWISVKDRMPILKIPRLSEEENYRTHNISKRALYMQCRNGASDNDSMPRFVGYTKTHLFPELPDHVEMPSG